MTTRTRLATWATAMVLGTLSLSTVQAANNDKRSDKHPASAVDPLYSRTAVTPTPDTVQGAPWLYADTELEAWRLQLMRQLVKDARLRVRYPGVYYTPSNRTHFRVPMPVDARYPQFITLNAFGDVVVKNNGQTIYTAANSEKPHKFKVTGPGSLLITLTTEQEPPTLRIDKGVISTDNTRWEASSDSITWAAACHYPQYKDGTLPHRYDTPTVRLKPVSTQNDTLYDFGRQLFGFIVVKANSQPDFFAGESILEAVDTAARPREQSFDLEQVGVRLPR